MDNTALRQQNVKLLDSISSSCVEIQQSLKEHLEKTTSLQYKSQIEKDIVTLENLKLITIAIKTDIEFEQVGASTELLLRIAANDFKNKLAVIPEKKTVRDGATESLKEVHRNILHMTTEALKGA